jgi:serralysin
MTSKFITDPQDPWDGFLSTSGAEFYGSFAGTGPELKYAGCPVAAGQFGTWTPIRAEQTASGYEVAWKFPSSDQYTVWNTDSNGGFGSNTGAVSGTSSILESLESASIKI